jgi:hypothetical protein
MTLRGDASLDHGEIILGKWHRDTASNQFGETFIRRHESQAVKFPRAGVDDFVLGPWAEREAVARRDRHRYATALGDDVPVVLRYARLIECARASVGFKRRLEYRFACANATAVADLETTVACDISLRQRPRSFRRDP